ncbi:DinB family protein [Negadavirga shengliensis]|uniref:DinB family protein n=1 Tax=Negadavirga shengliensis TaxID=1389218 RepID=A0ABV9T2H1_9BACT
MGRIQGLMAPGPEEYKPYYERYIASVIGTDIDGMLDRQTAFIKAYYEKLDEERALKSYAPGKWTFKEVLGHLIDTEKVFHFRGVCIARDEKTFLPGFDQDKFVDSAGFNGMEKDLLIQSFELNRLSWACFMDSLREDDWQKTGLVDAHPMSLRAIAYILAGHMEHHIRLFQERYDAIP